MPKVTKTELTAAQKTRLVETLLESLPLCSDADDILQWRADAEPSIRKLDDAMWVRHIEDEVKQHENLITENQQWRK